MLRRRLVFIPPRDKGSLISQEYWLRVNEFIKGRQLMAPRFLLLKQSIFHHVNHITTDPLLRIRSFTVSACERHRTRECTWRAGPRAIPCCCSDFKKGSEKRGPWNDVIVTCAQHWLFPKHDYIHDFIWVANVSDKQGKWYYSNLLMKNWIRKLTKLREVT